MDSEGFAMAKQLAEEAFELDPNGAEIHNHLGYFLSMDGNFEEAILLYEKAIRLNPYPPSFYYNRLGSAYALMERYDDAIDVCKKGLKRQPSDFMGRFILAAVYIWQGREEEAQIETSKILNVISDFSLSSLRETSLYKNKEIIELWIEALGKAGFTE